MIGQLYGVCVCVCVCVQLIVYTTEEEKKRKRNSLAAFPTVLWLNTPPPPAPRCL